MQEVLHDRNRKIIKYSIFGIIMNLLLSVLKIVFGVSVNSHAVMLDGVNGLSDIFSAVMTIISSAFGNRRASRKHPLGFGRLEYIFSLVITMVIGVLAVRAIIDSVKTIIHPDEPPVYTTFVLVLMIVSFVMKLSYGIFLRKKGKALNSIAMIMTGTESMGDALVSANPEAAEIWDRILEVVKQDPEILRAHSFYVDFETKEIVFSIVPDHAVKDKVKENQIEQEICSLFPDMSVRVHAVLDM